jgi:hypothetical protein
MSRLAAGAKRWMSIAVPLPTSPRVREGIELPPAELDAAPGRQMLQGAVAEGRRDQACVRAQPRCLVCLRQ